MQTDAAQKTQKKNVLDYALNPECDSALFSLNPLYHKHDWHNLKCLNKKILVETTYSQAQHIGTVASVGICEAASYVYVKTFISLFPPVQNLRAVHNLQ